MKIFINKNDYRKLLDILFLAEWMLNATKTEPDPKTEKYNSVLQQIYSYAKDFGCGDIVQKSDLDDEYYQDDNYEQNPILKEIINEYNNDTFWGELISRLTIRDVMEKAGGEKRYRDLSLDQIMDMDYPIREKYEEEFYTNGLKNLILKK
jgi:hypothetical protein